LIKKQVNSLQWRLENKLKKIPPNKKKERSSVNDG